MTNPQTTPYGTWKSPITTDMLVADVVRLGRIVPEGGDVYWVEGRPAEKGRSVIVRRTPDGQTQDVNPAPFNARTRVHEYGGAAFTVHEGTVYFSNFADQRLYRARPGEVPTPVTPEAARRYADGVVNADGQWMVCICEDHSGEGEAVNFVARVDLGDGSVHRLAAGNDFYATPRISPDGQQICWLTWSHPNMPWDGTELWVADLSPEGNLAGPRKIAGGAAESIFQPQWSPDGTLFFVSDQTNWWNLYRWQGDEVSPVLPLEAEFGLPQWVFDMSAYAFLPDGRVVAAYTHLGRWHLAEIAPDTGEWTAIETPYEAFTGVKAAGGAVYFQAGSPTRFAELVALETATRKTTVLRKSAQTALGEGYLSVPETIEFPTEEGLTAHAFFYPPRNQDFTAPEGERPPVIVFSHGGPTGATSSTLGLGVQYWTSRGFGVVDVNYGGSTGYGRAYRQRLNGKWGTVDVDDCVNAAQYLVARGKADEGRLMIRGGSAGGYTTLAALTFRDVFGAGASYFGVSDLAALAKETHKFESRYLDSMLGPYPERKDLYEQYAPIHHVEQLDCPVIFFQGLEDKVVPPNQAEMMVDALRKKGVPVAYVPFEGEQHGFRQAKNIKRSISAELYFYGKVFGFEPADEIEPVEIENL